MPPPKNPTAPARPEWAIDKPARIIIPYVRYAPPEKVLVVGRSVRDLSWKEKFLKPAISVDILARYDSPSNTLWIAVYQVTHREEEEEIIWMTFSTLMESELMSMKWVQKDEAYCDGRSFSRDAIVHAWQAEEAKGTQGFSTQIEWTYDEFQPDLDDGGWDGDPTSGGPYFGVDDI